MAKILIPKRKIELVGQYNETSRNIDDTYITAHIQSLYHTLSYWMSFMAGKFHERLQIPVGTDMTDGVVAEIWIEGAKFWFIDENGVEQDLENFDQDLNTTDSVEFSEVLLTPKASSTGGTGTMYFSDDDNHFHLKVT